MFQFFLEAFKILNWWCINYGNHYYLLFIQLKTYLDYVVMYVNGYIGVLTLLALAKCQVLSLGMRNNTRISVKIKFRSFTVIFQQLLPTNSNNYFQKFQGLLAVVRTFTENSEQRTERARWFNLSIFKCSMKLFLKPTLTDNTPSKYINITYFLIKWITTTCIQEPKHFFGTSFRSS